MMFWNDNHVELFAATIIPNEITLLKYRNVVQVQSRPQGVKPKRYGVDYFLQLLGVTVIPKKVINFLRSTIQESILTREKKEL
jgi:hypothetical protein